jgi:hypothetical protein
MRIKARTLRNRRVALIENKEIKKKSSTRSETTTKKIDTIVRNNIWRDLLDKCAD